MNILMSLFAFIFLSSALQNNVPNTQAGDYFGTPFEQKTEELNSMYDHLAMVKTSKVPTVTGQFKVRIDEVCSKKGCWLNVAFETGEQAFVKMQDYAFFLPMNAQGKEAIIYGDLYMETISVKELQHYAEDAGQSKEEIAKITQPEEKLRLTAKGILIL